MARTSGGSHTIHWSVVNKLSQVGERLSEACNDDRLGRGSEGGRAEVCVLGPGRRRRRCWLVTLTPRIRAYRKPSAWTEGLRNGTRQLRHGHGDDMYRAS